MSDLARYDTVWSRAEPYMRARKNNVHFPRCRVEAFWECKTITLPDEVPV